MMRLVVIRKRDANPSSWRNIVAEVIEVHGLSFSMSLSAYGLSTDVHTGVSVNSYFSFKYFSFAWSLNV